MRWTPGPDGLAHARTRGVQLITASRPGYGRSDRLPVRRVVDWAVDANQVVKRLDVGHAGIGAVGNTIDTDVTTLSATTKDGGVFIREANSFTVSASTIVFRAT